LPEGAGSKREKERLSMHGITPPTKLEGIEATRGIAALLVVFVHCMNMLSGPKDSGREAFGGFFVFGHVGVDFFFVLSGFVILHAHFRDIGKPERLGRYFSRRLTRIYPIYWVASLLMLAIFVMSPSQSGRELQPDVIIRSIMLVPQLDGPVLAPGWSLQHEMMFYIAFALLIIRASLGMTLLGAWVVAILVAVALGVSNTTANGLLSVFNLDFFLGMGAAWVLHKHRSVPWRSCLIIGVAVFAGTALAEVPEAINGHGSLARMMRGAGAFLIILGLVEGERRGAFRVPAILRELGKSSYSIYLFHIPFILILQQTLRWTRLNSILPAEVVFLSVTALTVIASMATCAAIEYPLMRACRIALDDRFARYVARRSSPSA
jgi:peptidoglycan/LPS O-acetylase OafA/YrhL